MIIGLTGQKGSGKDSVGRILTAKHGFTRLAFADGIKDLLLEMDPMVTGCQTLRNYVDLHGWDIAKQHPTIRGYLQRLGVGLRDVDPNIWIRPLHAYLAANALRQHIVVTDVRFRNEAELIWDFEGKVLLVERGPVSSDSHITETELLTIEHDEVIPNRSSLEMLDYEVRRMVRWMSWEEDRPL